MQPGPQFVESGSTIETEIPNAYRFTVHCGVEWLGTLNDVTWRAAVPEGSVSWIPPAWQPVVGSDESILVTVFMSPGPDPTLTATANGFDLVYRPAREPAPGCD